jgi:CRAL/TRIO domain
LPRTFDYKEKSKMFEYYPQYYHKTDKVHHSSLTPHPLGDTELIPTPPQDGRPLYIEQLGNIDLAAMYKITTAERMLQNLVTEYEKLADPRLPACCRKAGKLLETCCTIMDLKGVGVSKVSSVYGYVKSASAILQNYYPERLGKLYLINAPWGFSGAFNLVKSFLDPVTVQKIHVLGAGYHSELLAQVPKENLPKEFGGECVCEGGCALSDAGPWQDPKWVKTPKWAQKQGGNEEDGAIDQGKMNDGPQMVGKGEQRPVQAEPRNQPNLPGTAPAHA